MPKMAKLVKKNGILYIYIYIYIYIYNTGVGMMFGVSLSLYIYIYIYIWTPNIIPTILIFVLGPCRWVDGIGS